MLDHLGSISMTSTVQQSRQFEQLLGNWQQVRGQLATIRNRLSHLDGWLSGWLAILALGYLGLQQEHFALHYFSRWVLFVLNIGTRPLFLKFKDQNNYQSR